MAILDAPTFMVLFVSLLHDQVAMEIASIKQNICSNVNVRIDTRSKYNQYLLKRFGKLTTLTKMAKISSNLIGQQPICMLLRSLDDGFTLEVMSAITIKNMAIVPNIL